MKKIFLALALIFFSQIASFSAVFAQWWEWSPNQKIVVSEKPLGAKNCYCATVNKDAPKWAKIEEKYKRYDSITKNGSCPSNVPVAERLYVCEEETLGGMIQGIVAYIIKISLLLGALATAALGVAWGIAWGDDPEYKKNLKNWLVWLIVGLIIIWGFQYILGIFGWVYVFGK